MKTVMMTAAILATLSGTCLAQGKPVKPTDPTTSGIAPATLYDATGKAVGLYEDPNFAIFRYNRAVIAIALAPRTEGGLRHSAQLVYGEPGSPAFFASADCSGIPFPSDSQSLQYAGSGSPLFGLRPVAYTLSSGQVTAHIAASEFASLKSYASVSFMPSTNGVLTSQCSVQSGTTNGYNVETSVILPATPLIVQ